MTKFFHEIYDYLFPKQAQNQQKSNSSKNSINFWNGTSTEQGNFFIWKKETPSPEASINLTPQSQRKAKQNQNKRESSKPVTMEPQKVQGTSQHKGELSTLFSKLVINHFV